MSKSALKSTNFFFKRSIYDLKLSYLCRLSLLSCLLDCFLRVMAYVIVVFTEENETALIAKNWLVDGTGNDGPNSLLARWPPYKSYARVSNAAMKMEPPSETWISMPVRILYRSGNNMLLYTLLRML